MGGADVYLKSLLNAGETQGYSIVLFCRKNFPLEMIMTSRQNLKLKIHYINDIKNAGSFSKILKLRTIFKRERVDVLHFNGSHHKSAVVAARLAKIRVILATYHLLPPLRDKRWWRMRKAEELIQILCLNGVIYVSKTAQKEWTKFLGVGGKKFKIVYYGIDLKRFNEKSIPEDVRFLKTKLGLEENDLIVGINARLAPMKGHRYLIEAAPLIREKVPTVKFLIAGEGEIKVELQEIVRSKNLQDSFLFLGFCQDIAQITHIYDVAALPSTYENFSFAALEAMACAKPLVVSNIGGFPEMVVDGVTGLVINSGDSRALAEAIIMLLENPAKRVQMGRLGRKRAEELFVEERMVRETYKVYDYLRSQRL